MKFHPRVDKNRLVVGLDSSTTSTKAIAFDRHGKVVAHAAEAIPLTSPKPNQYEQNPDHWWHSAHTALKRITREVNPERIVGLAVSNQRETFVPLDAAGKVLRPAIIWLDERCKDEVESFSRKIGKERIHRITGKPPDYAPVVYRLAWMKRHEPLLFRKIRMICDVHAYLAWKMTGSFMTSWASADPLGLLDLRNKRWFPAILDALEMDERQLPGVSSPGRCFQRRLSSSAGNESTSVGRSVPRKRRLSSCIARSLTRVIMNSVS